MNKLLPKIVDCVEDHLVTIIGDLPSRGSVAKSEWLQKIADVGTVASALIAFNKASVDLLSAVENTEGDLYG